MRPVQRAILTARMGSAYRATVLSRESLLGTVVGGMGEVVVMSVARARGPRAAVCGTAGLMATLVTSWLIRCGVEAGQQGEGRWTRT